MPLVKTPREVIELIDREKIEVVDLRFMDLSGRWRGISMPATVLDEDSFKIGLELGGSGSDESELLAKPVPETGFIDPFLAHRTLVLLSDVMDPLAGADFPGDPRGIARRAEAWLKSTGSADAACFGPEVEFFIFDEVRFDQGESYGYYSIESGEDRRSSAGGKSGPTGEAKVGENPFAAPPADSLQDLCSEMMLTLMKIGIDTEAAYHQADPGGRCRLDLRFAPLTQMADNLMKFKYVIKHVARKHDKSATFMPMPLHGGGGSGMHLNFSLWKAGLNLFSGNGYAGLSETALYAAGGLLKHAPALAAISNPTTNSFKRLAPGREAPIHLVYSGRNRTAALRVPPRGRSEKSKRLQFRSPDPSANPYLSFAAVLMAAADGIRNKLHPGEAFDQDIRALPSTELSRLPRMPASLREALMYLQKDHDWLIEGGVFDERVINDWIANKLTDEVEALDSRPHPWEFERYFNI